jgi:poly-gamma-glutamate synthesis protein (capsule biosynthesis protein)
VVAHHPHVLQGISEYKGKYIVYSLGNFCFGGNTTCKDKDTMIFQQTFTLVDGEVQPDADFNIIPCSISTDSSTNTYCPTPATGDEADRILTKIYDMSAELEGGITR